MMSHDDMMGCIATEAHEACCHPSPPLPEKQRYRAPLSERLSVWLRNLWHWRTAWAVRYLSKQLQRDKEFRDAWQANIAMPIYDATRPICTCPRPEYAQWEGHDSACPRFKAHEMGQDQPMSAEFCNVVADRLMKHLFDA